MTAVLGGPVLRWTALAAALLLVPAPSPVARRLAALRRGGRLSGGGGGGGSGSAADGVRGLRGVGDVPGRGRGWSGRGRTVLAARQWPARRGALPAGTAAGGVAGLLHGVALGVATGVVAATAVTVLVGGLGRRRDDAVRRRLLEALRLLVVEIEAGTSPAAALVAAADVVPDWAPALVAAARALRTGDDVAAVLAAGAAQGPRAGRHEIVALGHAWRVVAATGAPVGDVLGRLAGDLAAGQDRRRAVSAALAGPRSSSILLAGLPLIGIGLGTAMGARPAQVLTETQAGRALGCAGAVLGCLGVLWTRRITARAESP